MINHSSSDQTVCPHAAFLQLCRVSLPPPPLKMSTSVNQSSWQACGAGRWYSHFEEREAKCESWHENRGVPTSHPSPAEITRPYCPSLHTKGPSSAAVPTGAAYQKRGPGRLCPLVLHVLNIKGKEQGLISEFCWWRWLWWLGSVLS